jgi:predicted transposase/invertase (TIGR01784 family)
MTETIHNVHDKLIKTIFSNPRDAASFFESYLPEALAALIDWSTLILMPAHFIDESMKKSESDLLFHVTMKERKGSLFLYILFEHQSTPDKWMKFRLLKYMCRIWDESFKDNPKQECLIPVLPVVFYQGKNEWIFSQNFEDLFSDIACDDSFIPKFQYLLIDQSDSTPDEMQGTVNARLVQMLMKAAFHGQMMSLYEELSELLTQIPRTGGINYLKVFILYILETQDRQTVEELTKRIRNKSIGEEMLSAAQTYWLEGKEEGKKEGKKEGKEEGKEEGKLETIESFLKIGIDWDTITKATGITYEKLVELKSEIQKSRVTHG